MPPYNSSPAVVSDWLTSHFIAAFERDVDPTIWTPIPYPGGVHHRGFGAIVVLTLMYCDAMTGLIDGHASSAGTEATVKFIETEVAANAGDPVTKGRYEARGAALFHMYRHGPAHQREPQLLRWDGMEVAWSMMRGGSAANHLRLERGNPWFHLHVDAALAQKVYDGALEAVTPQSPGCGKSGHVGQRLSAMLQNPDM